MTEFQNFKCLFFFNVNLDSLHESIYSPKIMVVFYLIIPAVFRVLSDYSIFLRLFRILLNWFSLSLL